MSSEYLITIKGRRAGSSRKGPVRRLGRSEYLARRLSDTAAPFFVSFWNTLVTPDDGTVTFDFSYENLGDRWWLRPDDVVVAVVLSESSVTVASGFATLVSGDCSIYWKRWKSGDPKTVDFTVAAGVGNEALVRVMVLRNAATAGSPFKSQATRTGTGRVVTLPSVNAAPDDLCIFTWYQGGAIPPSPLAFPGESVNPATLFDNFGGFFLQASSVTNVGPVFVGNPKQSGPTTEWERAVYTESGPWVGVSLAVKPKKPLSRVLAGPHASTQDISGDLKPLLIEGDIVVTYVVSDSSSISIPETFGDGWAPMTGTPIANGSKYLHAYWKRWAGGTWDVDSSSTGFMRLLTVARGARSSGNPFGSVALTIGSGTSIAGASISANKNQLVFFAAVASTFTGGSANALGPITPGSVTDFEVDGDSDSLLFYTWQYRTSSGYAPGGTVTPFSASFNKSASFLWTVTFSILK